MNKYFIILRCLLWAVVLVAISHVIHLPSPLWFLFLTACLGTVIAWQSVLNFETPIAAVLRFVIVGGCGYATSWILGNIPTTTGSFYFTDLSFHATFGVITCLLAFASCWLLSYTSLYFFFESTLVGFSGVLLFANHRSFRFDKLELISELSWRFGISPAGILTILGLISSCIYIVYIIVTPSASNAKSVSVQGRRLSWWSALSSLACIAILTSITYGIYSYYQGVALTRLMNGVGMSESSEGVSPLDFNSALGGTNQPAVLVRLEGDYPKNPYSPVLFFRESALSEFNGHELVQAGTGFDADNPRNIDSFTSNDQTGAEHRTNLVQSIFTLIEHKLFIGVDYPIEIRLLKNPNPGRFKSAYRVYSMAASYPKELTASGDVGEESWSKEQWEHYTKPHPDPRYAELAKKIIGEEASPVAQARLIDQYLIKNAIYTITPGHNVKAEDDPVAPFLFGDLRGYCVHFAHAMVYMLRSLGIPARVGTGYLTDLGQAKDGHILLRLNDRHAWAEVYIRGIGWTVFDVQPEKVESHAASEVDGRLLEELMGMIGTPSEFTDSKEAQHEPALQPEDSNRHDLGYFLYKTLIILILIAIIAKLYIRYSWILPSSKATKIKRHYRSLASWLTDLGFGRAYGETRAEYRSRIERTFSKDILLIVTPLLEALYSVEVPHEVSTIPSPRLPKLPLLLTLKGMVSVASVGRWIGGRAW